MQHKKELKNAKNKGKPSQKKQNKLQKNIDAIIKDYFLKKSFPLTLKVYQKEIDSANFESNQEKLFKQKLIKSFEAGNRGLFFQFWRQYIDSPLNKSGHNKQVKLKVEFYCQIWFAVFAVHPHIGKQQGQVRKKSFDKGRIKQFMQFLETKGAELAQTTEFMPFYALPYIKKPLEHPALKQIFTKEWVTAMRQKLTRYLQEHYEQNQNPMLYKLYESYVNKGTMDFTKDGKQGSNDPQQYMDYIKDLETNKSELMNIIQEFSMKYEALQNNYKVMGQREEAARLNLVESQQKWKVFTQDLVKVSTELFSEIKSIKSGKQSNEKLMKGLQEKIDKSEQFLQTSVDEYVTASDINSQPQQSQFNAMNYSISDNERRPGYSPNQFTASPQKIQQNFNFYFPLNFTKIKEEFKICKSAHLLCAILQAIRWRITKTRGAQVRREVVIAIQTNDMLGIHNPKNQKTLLENLLNQNQKVKEYTTRFINALASDYLGRTYLLETEMVLHLLINLLKTEQGDTIIRRSALGSLQKLSLRKLPQMLMIKNDLIKWIIEILKNEKDNLSEYSYEYATALFMNLSLRTEGKKKCEEHKLQVLETLIDILEHENIQVRTFVNGSLYSLLTRSKLKEQAKELGLREMLEMLAKNQDERIKKQIEYILEQLQKDTTDDQDINEEGSLSEEDNDVDEFEDDEEIGEDEDVEDYIPEQGNMIGEVLLIHHYNLSQNEAQVEIQKIHTIYQQTQKIQEQKVKTISGNYNDPKDLFSRPTTPQMLSNMTQNSAKSQKPIVPQQESQIPSELRSRHRILRTPADGDRSDIQKMVEIQEKQIQEQEIKRKKMMTKENAYDPPRIPKDQKEGTHDYKTAFNSQPRITRTPPNIPEINEQNKF